MYTLNLPPFVISDLRMFAANEKVFKLFSNRSFLIPKYKKDILKQNKYRLVCIFSSYMPLNETSKQHV